MTFTDDDLKRLKSQLALEISPDEDVLINNGEVDALLARLEAAERCINPANCYAVDYEAWRKASGKEPSK